MSSPRRSRRRTGPPGVLAALATIGFALLASCIEMPTPPSFGENGRGGSPTSSGSTRQISANQSIGGISGSDGSRADFRLELPSGLAYLDVRTAGGSGDADLTVLRGSVEECSSAGYDNDEHCLLYAPAGGTWTIRIAGYTAFSGLTLAVNVGSGSSSGGSGSGGSSGGSGSGGSSGGGSGGSSGGGTGGSVACDPNATTGSAWWACQTYSRVYLWHYVGNGRKVDVTINGVTIGPVGAYHQSSGPDFSALGTRCPSQDPSAPIYNSALGQTWIQMAAFRTEPGVTYRYTAVWDDGVTRTGTITGPSRGYCDDQRILR